MSGMSGRVCEKHQRWCPDENCQYCLPEAGLGLGVILDDPKRYFGIDNPLPLTYMGMPIVVDPNMRPGEPPVLMGTKEIIACAIRQRMAQMDANRARDAALLKRFGIDE